MGAGIEAPALEPVDTVEALLTTTEVMGVEQSCQQLGWPIDWCTPFLDCLIQDELLEDRAEAHCIP